MKILLVQNTDWLKRNPATQHHLAEMLSLRGHQIRVIDFEITWKSEPNHKLRCKRQVFDNISKIYKQANITVIRPGIIKLPFIDYLSFMFSKNTEITNQIREFKPDIIVGMGISTLLAIIAAKRHKLPVVNYWIDVSHRLLPNKCLQPFGWLIERQTVKMADKVLAMNDKLRDYVIKIGAVPERTFVVKAGINVKHFNPNIPGMREELGLQQSDIVLFFMGWLYNFSGLKELSLQITRIENRSLKLLIVGEGDAYASLQKIIKDKKLQERVLLVGQKPFKDIPKYIASADICVLPSYTSEPIMRDIVPIKLYEYMAMKKPVISTKLPGVMKEFGNDNGVVYVDKTEDIINIVPEIINNITELGNQARKFVENNTWDNITDTFENILKNAISEKSKIY